MTVEQTIKKIIRELKKIEAVKAIYLFGSFAFRRERPFSDVDLCVITDKASKTERASISSCSSRKVQISIFDELPLYIRFEVLKGKKLFVRDEEFLHRLIFLTCRKYQDFQPLLRRFENFYKVKV